jgi:hypothetical protein
LERGCGKKKIPVFIVYKQDFYYLCTSNEKVVDTNTGTADADSCQLDGGHSDEQTMDD